MLVDSHCHLDFPDFGDDLDGVLARAAQAGVGTLQTHLHAGDPIRYGPRPGRRLMRAIWCSVGIHPHHVAEEPEVSADHLVRMAEHPKVIGIGETGLDFHYDNSPRPQQEASFRQHIAAARETGLPLIVHTRSADEDTCRILRDEAGKGAFPGVIHCFSAGRAVAETALEIGLYVSFSGILTFKNAEEVRAVARDVPLDRLLVETDAPYLAPVPHRGRRNEPAHVVHTAARLAELKGMDDAALAQMTTANFFKLFSKSIFQSAEIA